MVFCVVSLEPCPLKQFQDTRLQSEGSVLENKGSLSFHFIGIRSSTYSYDHTADNRLLIHPMKSACQVRMLWSWVS